MPEADPIIERIDAAVAADVVALHVGAASAAPGRREPVLLPGRGDPPPQISRATLLRRTAAGAGAAAGVVVALMGVPTLAASTPSAEQDREILNLALLLERVQVAFYARALDRLPLRGELQQFARTVHGHEQAHAAAVAAALGPDADRAPEIDVEQATADVDAFRTASVALEDLVVGAYNGQATNLTPEALRTAVRIASVEARHAAWARAIADEIPAPVGVDPLLSEQQVRSRLDELVGGAP